MDHSIFLELTQPRFQLYQTLSQYQCLKAVPVKRRLQVWLLTAINQQVQSPFVPMTLITGTE